MAETQLEYESVSGFEHPMFPKPDANDQQCSCEASMKSPKVDRVTGKVVDYVRASGPRITHDLRILTQVCNGEAFVSELQNIYTACLCERRRSALLVARSGKRALVNAILSRKLLLRSQQDGSSFQIMTILTSNLSEAVVSSSTKHHPFDCQHPLQP